MNNKLPIIIIIPRGRVNIEEWKKIFINTMNFSLVKVLLNIIICLLSYLLYDFIKKNRNDWELVSPLDFEKYTNNVSTNEMLYNISKVIEKNERLNHTLDSLRKTLFFKIFKLNLEPDCNIFKQEQICRSA